MSNDVTKFNDDIMGRQQFIEHLLETTLEKTNDALTRSNMKTFQYYSQNREDFPDEYLIARQTFSEELHVLLTNIENELLNELEVA